MKYYPSYYRDFYCLADKCPDSCCKGWEICIDENTLKYYKSLDSDFGRTIKASIAEDSDGDSYFCQKNGRCPFLNEKNLCDIHIKLGEDKTSEICREHPRFIEIYDDFTEISLSASCPMANSLIFADGRTGADYPEPATETDDELLEILIAARKFLFMPRRYKSFDEMLILLKNVSITLTDEIDADSPYYDKCFVYDKKTAVFIEKELLAESEILTEEWKNILINSAEKTVTNKAVKIHIADNRKKLEQFYYYLLYRYFLKAINDEEIMLNSAFISVLVLLCADISFKNNLNIPETAGIISKEIEHDTVNIDLLQNFLFDNSDNLSL